VTASRLWLIVAAFIAGLIVTPLYLIMTTGGDEDVLPGAYGTVELAAGTDEAPTMSPASMTPPSPATATAVSTATALPTSVPVSPLAATPKPEIATPTPLPSQQPAVVARGAAPSLTGRYRIADTITEGAGAGMVASFDVDLQQAGNAVTGGNSEIRLTGQIEGNTVRAQFVQPALGYSGTFVWNLQGSSGSGTFTSSVPNAGVSQLTRL